MSKILPAPAKLISKISLVLLFGIFSAVSILFFAQPTQALISSLPCPPNLPLILSCFGGRIVGIIPPIPFVCWGTQYIILGPHKPATVAVIPGISRVYLFFQLRPGVNAGGVAMPAIPFICGDADIVLRIGTSAF